MNPAKIIIIGGGFAGIRVALTLDRAKIPGSKIILLSDKPHFEYNPTLYRVVTGRSPLQVCIPLRDIFDGTRVEVLEDTIEHVNLAEKSLSGKSTARYHYDFLVLALGSETNYFDIPGLKERAFGFKSISEALRLKRHLHKSLAENNSQIVIVGGGATGIELAGELSAYTKKLGRLHDFNPSNLAIDLIEAAPRLAAGLPERFSEKIKARLQRLGVNIFLSRAVLREDLERVYLKDMELRTKTVIWTAGVKPNRLYAQIEGLALDQKGRVTVTERLEARGRADVFVAGDGAATPYSGMAQTALFDGEYIARAITARLQNKKVPAYQPKKPFYSIPAGPGWAATLIGDFAIYGRASWWLRRLADLRFFLSILPIRKALRAFWSESTLTESCPICTAEGGETK